MSLLQALVHARDLTPTQGPVILWAFAVLRYNPVVAVLSALDQQIEKLASQITAQVSPTPHASCWLATPCVSVMRISHA